MYDTNRSIGLPEIAKHISRSFHVQLEEALRTNFKDPAFGVSSLAKVLFVSEDTLARRIAALYGPDTKSRDVLRRYRLEESRRQLLETNKSAAVVAEECGFREVANFNRMFKEAYGETPGRYRNVQSHLNAPSNSPPNSTIFSLSCRLRDEHNLPIKKSAKFQSL